MLLCSHYWAVRPRFPSGDGFSLSVGLTLTALSMFCLPRLSLGVPTESLMSGSILLGLVVWTAVEQVPIRMDELVLRGAHVVLAAVTMLPAVLFGAHRIVAGAPTGLGSDVLPAFGLILVGGLTWTTGRSRTTRVYLARETTHLTRPATESLAHRLVFDAVAVLGGLLLAAVVSGEPLSVWTAVGTLIGAAVGFAFSTPRTVRLTALDSGLVLDSGGLFGERFVPWRGVRGVESDDDAVRLRFRFPRPTNYRIDVRESDNRRRVADTLRRCHRR